MVALLNKTTVEILAKGNELAAEELRQANAHLNNVGMPSYEDLLDALISTNLELQHFHDCGNARAQVSEAFAQTVAERIANTKSIVRTIRDAVPE